jgi:hypothetical protein
VGTKVTVVNQPLVPRAGRRVVLQSFPPHEEHPDAKHAALGKRFTKNVKQALPAREAVRGSVDAALAEKS